MDIFVIMMLLNMALVWLMMYVSICLMIIILICSMIIVSREYFEITFISRKKGLCWPSVWYYLLFDIKSAQSIKAIFDAPRFEMIYDFHLQMSRKFSYTKLFSSGESRIFYWRKYCIFTIFSYTVFYARLGPYPCVEIKFLKKGDGLLCQILIILQC